MFSKEKATAREFWLHSKLQVLDGPGDSIHEILNVDSYYSVSAFLLLTKK